MGCTKKITKLPRYSMQLIQKLIKSAKEGLIRSLFILLLTITLKHILFTPFPSPNFASQLFPVSPRFYSRPKRIEDNGYAKFWGLTRRIMVYVKMVNKPSLPLSSLRISKNKEYPSCSLTGGDKYNEQLERGSQ